MDSKNYYDLQILNELEEVPSLTNRLAAEKLGVSVKLTHSIFKGLIKRGLIHVSKRDGRSLYYLLTPKGIAEKVRLTYEFMDFSTQFFKEARRRSSEVCRRLAADGVSKVAFLGCGELAEISYLSLKEHGLKLTAVFEDGHKGESFMGQAIKPLNDLMKERSQKSRQHFDKILVTTYDPAFPARGHFVPKGLEADERFVWVFDHNEMVQDIADRAPRLAPDEGDT